MQKAAIFGAAGAIGPYVADELERRDVPYRVVGSSRWKLGAAFGKLAHAEIFDADLTDPRSAGAAAQGVDTIVYTVGLPTRVSSSSGLMRTTVDAAVGVNVQRLVVVSSVYSYGVPRTERWRKHIRASRDPQGQDTQGAGRPRLEAQKRGPCAA